MFAVSTVTQFRAQAFGKMANNFAWASLLIRLELDVARPPSRIALLVPFVHELFNRGRECGGRKGAQDREEDDAECKHSGFL